MSRPEFDPIKAAEEIFASKTAAFSDEIKRLREIESDYIHLLTLVVAVASQDRFSRDQELTIVITKAEQVASESWEDLLRKHFAEKARTRLINV